MHNFQKEYEEMLRLGQFVNPLRAKNRIAQNLSGLSEYSLVDNSGKNQLAGQYDKRFVRLSVDYFVDLIEQIKNNPDCSIVTYLNKKNIREGAIPQNISTLIKLIERNPFRQDEDRRKIFSEVISPKILNVFGVKTVFNKYLVVGKDRFVLSVDFLKENQRFFTGYELCDKKTHADVCLWVFPVDYNLTVIESNLKYLRNVLSCEYQIDDPIIDIETIKKEFLMAYLVRVLLLGDSDFYTRNIGYVFDENTNKMSFAPCFDFEHTFTLEGRALARKMKDLELIKQNCSEVYHWFKAKLAKLNQKNKNSGNKVYVDIIKSELQDEELQNYYTSYIQNNVSALIKMFLELDQSSREMQ